MLFRERCGASMSNFTQMHRNMMVLNTLLILVACNNAENHSNTIDANQATEADFVSSNTVAEFEEGERENTENTLPATDAPEVILLSAFDILGIKIGMSPKRASELSIAAGFRAINSCRYRDNTICTLEFSANDGRKLAVFIRENPPFVVTKVVQTEIYTGFDEAINSLAARWGAPTVTGNTVNTRRYRWCDVNEKRCAPFSLGEFSSIIIEQNFPFKTRLSAGQNLENLLDNIEVSIRSKSPIVWLNYIDLEMASMLNVAIGMSAFQTLVNVGREDVRHAYFSNSTKDQSRMAESVCKDFSNLIDAGRYEDLSIPEGYFCTGRFRRQDYKFTLRFSGGSQVKLDEIIFDISADRDVAHLIEQSKLRFGKPAVERDYGIIFERDDKQLMIIEKGGRFSAALSYK